MICIEYYLIHCLSHCNFVVKFLNGDWKNSSQLNSFTRHSENLDQGITVNSKYKSSFEM